MPSMEHSAIAEFYGNTLSIVDGDPIIVPWHPDVGFTNGKVCASYGALPDDSLGEVARPLQGCPSGYSPMGLGDNINSMEYLVQDIDIFPNLMPLVSHFTSGGYVTADDLAIFALDDSSTVMAESWTGDLAFVDENALANNQLAALELVPLNRVDPPGPLIQMWYYGGLEPPCSGCDRSVDAYQLALGERGDPSTAIRFAAYLERPRECGTWWEFPLVGPPVLHYDEDTYPCCRGVEPPDPPAE